MSLLIADFTSSIDNDNSLLTLTDSSTADHGFQVIANRYFHITHPNGSVETLALLGSEVGDSVTYPITKDMAITVELEIIPETIEEGSFYTKTRNLLLPGLLTDKLADLRKEFFLERPVRELLCDCHENLKHIELIESCLQAAKDFICINISTAQEALDLGHELSTIYVFD